MTTPSYEIG